MVARQTREELLALGEIVGPPAERSCTDQNFELPGGIYVAMALLFAAFPAVLALSFSGGHMPVAFGVIAAFIGAFFAVPTLFPHMSNGVTRSQRLSWFEFRDRGIMTATGHASAGEATTLVLLLPVVIFCFGVAVVVIASLV